MNICVVGLGKIGLPLAVQYTLNGHSVIGSDIDSAVVERAEKGLTNTTGEPGLDGALRIAVQSGRFHATVQTSDAVQKSEVVVMVPPVLLDPAGRPDFESLDAAVKDVGAGLQRGTLIILESTVPVGVTRGRVGPLLEDCSGLAMGEDFLLAFSPERVSSGSIFHDLATYPKIVGAIDARSASATAEFYREALNAEVTLLSDVETAEFTKLAETTYRDVNIALANELARAADAMGIDFAEAAKAANSQPFSHLHTPGVGVGGHCIPVYPHFLNQDRQLPLVSTARKINDGMATYAVSLLETCLGDLSGRPFVILGLGYRANVPEARYSSTLLLDRALREKGAKPQVYDPLFSPEYIASLGLHPLVSFPPDRCDGFIVQAFHDAFRDIDFGQAPGCKVVLDGRNVLLAEDIEAKGIRYLRIGRGDVLR